jgi:hypothetical protein
MGIVAVLSQALLLGACALNRMVDSEVRSFAGTAGALTGVNYRFERLPSQQNAQQRQDRIEAMAAQALERVGLTRNDAQARYAVEVGVRVDQYARNPQRVPYHHDFFDRFGRFPGESSLLMLEPPWYLYTVHLLFRDTSTGMVAYETSAAHDGPWGDSAKLLPAIFEAALRDYPNPPTGPRKVVIEVPANPSKD